MSHFIYLTENIFGKLKIDCSYVRYPDGKKGSAAETHAIAILECADIPVSISGGVGGTGPDRIKYTVWGTDESCRFDGWYEVFISDGDAWVPSLNDLGDPRLFARNLFFCSLENFMSGAPHELPDFKTALSTQLIVEGILS